MSFTSFKLKTFVVNSLDLLDVSILHLSLNIQTHLKTLDSDWDRDHEKKMVADWIGF